MNVNTLILLFIFLHFGYCDTNKRSAILSRQKPWATLGKFMLSSSSQIRAHLKTSLRTELTDLSDLYIYFYSIDSWKRAVKAPNCTNKLELLTEQKYIRVPLNGSWSNWVPLRMPSDVFVIAAVDCYGTYSAQIFNHPTEFEIIGANPLEFLHDELEPGQTGSFNLPKIEDVYLPPPSTGGKTKSIIEPIIGLVILIGVIAAIHFIYEMLTVKEFLFSSVVLIVTVLLQFANLIVILIAISSSGPFLWKLSNMAEMIIEYGLILHTTMLLIGWPNSNIYMLIGNAILCAVLLFIQVTADNTAVSGIIQILLLIDILIFYFIEGTKQTSGDKKKASVMFSTFCCCIALLTFHIIKCLSSFMLPSLFILCENLQLVYQAGIIGLALFLTAMNSK